jgi:hypothetical protein
MDESAFWQLIEECRPAAPDPEAVGLAETLTARLASGPLYEVKGFAEQLSWALYRLDRRELGQGLSGDAFLYTRCAAVAAGREAFESILSDPTEFAALASGLVWTESLLYVPDRAYQLITGEEWERNTRYSYESYSNAAGWQRT